MVPHHMAVMVSASSACLHGCATATPLKSVLFTLAGPGVVLLEKILLLAVNGLPQTKEPPFVYFPGPIDRIFVFPFSVLFTRPEKSQGVGIAVLSSAEL